MNQNSDGGVFPSEAFADVLEANADYQNSFTDNALTGVAAKGLAILTCMDSRIDPLRAVGMNRGDVKILRNAGARVTEDMLRTITLASYLLGVRRVLILPHTNCAMANGSEDKFHERIRNDFGVDTRSIEFRTCEDQVAALMRDVQRLRSFPLLHEGVEIGGAIYDVHTGAINPING